MCLPQARTLGYTAPHSPDSTEPIELNELSRIFHRPAIERESRHILAVQTTFRSLPLI
jgi:hypothetical protein